MSTERSATDLGDLRRGAAEILAAWRLELAAMARNYLGDSLHGDSGELIVEFTRERVALGWRRANATRQLGHVSRDQEQPARALRTLLAGSAEAIGRRRDAVVLLAPENVLRPIVRLPFASQRVLRSALTYELEKLSPVPPEEVYFDFTVLSRDRASNTAEVELRIIRRDIVGEAVRLCRAADLRVAAIRFGDDERPADPRSFPIDRNALLRGRWHRSSIAILGGATAVLLILVLLATYLRGAETLDALSDQVSNEGMRAARVEQLKARIDRTTAQLAFLGQQKRAPLFAAVLADVARTLPDGTWISEFDLTGNKIRIEGYSHSASDLIAVFDRSGRFANAQFAAPVTQGTAPSVERFDLTFDIAGAPR